MKRKNIFFCCSSYIRVIFGFWLCMISQKETFSIEYIVVDHLYSWMVCVCVWGKRDYKKYSKDVMDWWKKNWFSLVDVLNEVIHTSCISFRKKKKIYFRKQLLTKVTNFFVQVPAIYVLYIIHWPHLKILFLKE